MSDETTTCTQCGREKCGAVETSDCIWLNNPVDFVRHDMVCHYNDGSCAPGDYHPEDVFV